MRIARCVTQPHTVTFQTDWVPRLSKLCRFLAHKLHFLCDGSLDYEALKDLRTTGKKLLFHIEQIRHVGTHPLENPLVLVSECWYLLIWKHTKEHSNQGSTDASSLAPWWFCYRTGRLDSKWSTRYAVWHPLCSWILLIWHSKCMPSCNPSNDVPRRGWILLSSKTAIFCLELKVRHPECYQILERSVPGAFLW